MADTPRTWAILEALQLRLQGITVANGYRTDAGADVRLEPGDVGAAPSITLYTGATTRPEDARTPGERDFTLIVEAQVPVALDAAHATAVALAEDIEQALDGYVPLPSALPLRFQESLFLDRPDGVAAMA
ncbi:MAG TPA: hypothetical protein VL251_10735, partial [Thermomonas sp.]|nr:hypothetical protein [Thermomonas sp.]